jgi:alpha-tubulin suppressor-like RCC1 family protein
MTTKISGSQIQPFTIETTQLSNTAVAAFAVALAPKVLYANVANSAFTVLDDTAVNVGGGYIVVTGSEFQSGATVLIDTTPASAVTFVNSTTLRVQVPTKAAASYNLYVVNPDGGVGVKVSGITYSSDPIWVTSSPLSNQLANTAFNVTLSATGATSYAVAAGSTLPAGTSLLANGYFSGTVSIGAQTTYTFSVVATDAELQDSSKTFQVTVTVTPVYQLYTTGINLMTVGLDNSLLPNTSSPVQVGSATTWSDFSSATQYNYNTSFSSSTTLPTMAGVKTDGTLWTWGRNNFGQLGHNDTVDRSSPTQVGTGTTWSKVACGNANNAGTDSFVYIMAIKTDGTLWGWGVNRNAQLGLNDIDHRSSPTQIGSSTNWSKISCSTSHNNWYIPSWAAIKTDGTLWLCGNNNYGQLGQGNNTNSRSSPIQVGSLTNWAQVSAAGFRMHAVKTDNTLWSWGRAGYVGALGIDNNDRYSPTQVSGGSVWSFVTGQGDTTMAIRTNGTLWATGRNQNGVLGQNVGVYSNNIGGSPGENAIEGFTQIGTDTNWSTISLQAAGGEAQFAVALKTNGTLWAWGRNDEGQLGLNNLNSRSSPTQVGSLNTWTKAVAKAIGFLAITST